MDTPKNTHLRKETVKITLHNPTSSLPSLAPPQPRPLSNRSAPGSQPDWATIRIMNRLNLIYRRTEPARKQLDKACGQLLLLLGLLVLTLVWASIIAKMVVNAPPTVGETVLWMYNTVAFAPALMIISLIVANFIGSSKYRRAIAKEYTTYA